LKVVSSFNTGFAVPEIPVYDNPPGIEVTVQSTAGNSEVQVTVVVSPAEMLVGLAVIAPSGATPVTVTVAVSVTGCSVASVQLKVNVVLAVKAADVPEPEVPELENTFGLDVTEQLVVSVELQLTETVAPEETELGRAVIVAVAPPPPISSSPTAPTCVPPSRTTMASMVKRIPNRAVMIFKFIHQMHSETY